MTKPIDWVKRLTGEPAPTTADEAKRLVDKLNARPPELRRDSLALLTPAVLLRYHARCIRPFQPKLARGRPSTTENATPQSSTSPIERAALATRAYQLHLDDKSDQQIAIALIDPSVRQRISADAARKRARRLVDLGKRLSRQKNRPNP